MKFGFEEKLFTSGLKCYYCGKEYKGTDCQCGRGVDIDIHKQHMIDMYNKEYQPDLKGIAKGLIVLNIVAFITKDENKITTSWKKATEEQKKEARQLWKDGWKPKINIDI